MNIKLRRPRSCLGWLGWVFAVFFIFVLLNSLYAQVHLYIAYRQAMELAQQLGYTPDSFLRKGWYVANVDIVVGSAECSAALYYVTPLELSDFETRLLAARPGTRRINPGTDYLHEVYAELPLSRNGINGRQPGSKRSLPGIATVSWYLSGEGVVELYQTKRVTAALTFGERHIDGNIALIRRNAGRFPIWVWC